MYINKNLRMLLCEKYYCICFFMYGEHLVIVDDWFCFLKQLEQL